MGHSTYYNAMSAAFKNALSRFGPKFSQFIARHMATINKGNYLCFMSESANTELKYAIEL